MLLASVGTCACVYMLNRDTYSIRNFKDKEINLSKDKFPVSFHEIATLVITNIQTASHGHSSEKLKEMKQNMAAWSENK